MPSRPLEPGDPVRLGRFELLGRLGEGGQGVVYLGRGTNPGEERVAVKVLRSTVGDTSVGLTNDITFTFVAGERTIHETDQDSYGGSCVNTLTLREATATVLTFDEPQTGGCVAGTVTFRRQGASLAYRWTDNIEQNTATLRKS
jgi:hypothetical protein